MLPNLFGQILLLLSTILPKDSTALAFRVVNGILTPGGSYVQSQSFTLPLNLTAGNYTVFVQTDVNNQVTEFAPAADISSGEEPWAKS